MSTILNTPPPTQITIRPDRAATGNDALREKMLSEANQGNVLSAAKSSDKKEGTGGFWGKDGFTFGDLIDVINPLQHIPVVGTIYRAITGDEISTGARLAGGGLLGGVLGFAAAGVNAMVEHNTGQDIGDTVLAKLTGVGDEKAVASAQIDTSKLTKAQKMALENNMALLSAQPGEWEPIFDAESPEAIKKKAEQAAKDATAIKAEVEDGAAIQGMALDVDEYRVGLGNIGAAESRYRAVQAQSQMQQGLMDVKT